MNKITEIFNWFKNINLNTVIDISLALLIFLIFKLFSNAFSYLIVKLFNLKEKNKIKIKQNSCYRTISSFFSFLGIYLGLISLGLNGDIMVIINKVFRIIIIILVAITLANCITIKSPIFKHAREKFGVKRDENFIKFIIKLIRCIIYVIAAFIIITELGYNLNGLFAGLGLSGVIVALAAQDAAKNIFGGLVILWDKPFKIGDWIQTNTFEGIVEDITFRSTRVRSFDNCIITIPNTTITNDPLINWTKMKKRRYKENFELELSIPLKKLCDITNKITEMLQAHSRVLNERIIVKFDKVTPNGYNILVDIYTDALNYEDFLTTKENINYKIIDILSKEKVALAFPSSSVYINKKI